MIQGGSLGELGLDGEEGREYAGSKPGRQQEQGRGERVWERALGWKHRPQWAGR